jgi:hypothetical protein
MFNGPPPLPAAPSHLALYMAMYMVADESTAHLSGKDKWESLLRALCEQSWRAVRDPICCHHLLDPHHHSERLLIGALAAMDPDELIAICREQWPDDDNPATRLSPFLHHEDSFAISWT